jgi:choline dehydrogenase-like flavoprotein
MLGAEYDKLGRRKVKMQTCWRDTDIQGIKRAQAVFAEEIARAGLGRFEVALDGELPLLDTAGTSHHMGTTRMHIDPKQGVVDENCGFTVSQIYSSLAVPFFLLAATLILL